MGTKNKPGAFDCYTNAHPDEPMFILLGRDFSAPALVERWADNRERERGPSAKVDEARECAAAMRRWQARPPEAQRQRIVINGVSQETDGKPLAYEDVVRLAGMTGTPSVTWHVKNASGGLSDGIMHPGCFSIVPSDGLHFRVGHTGNA